MYPVLGITPIQETYENSVDQRHSTQSDVLKPTMTKLTSDTALRVMFQKYMKPRMSITTIPMVIRIMRAEKKSKPRRRKVTMKMAPIQMQRFSTVSLTMVRYCSQNTYHTLHKQTIYISNLVFQNIFLFFFSPSENTNDTYI